MPDVGGTRFHGGGATVDTVDTTHDISNDARRVLYIVMAGAQGGGERPGRTASSRQGASRVLPQLPDEEEFAERAARRLEAVADRLEQESRKLRVVDGETLARAQKLRVAAFIVRGEAKVAARREQLLLRAAGERDKVGLLI
jgi:hypothetical protein